MVNIGAQKRNKKNKFALSFVDAVGIFEGIRRLYTTDGKNTN